MTDREREILDKLRGHIEDVTGAVLLWGDDDELVLRKLALGIPQIDLMLDGGLAHGRMSELIGAYSTGKTILAYQALKAAIAAGLPAVYVDAERSWDAEWATTVGLDPAKVIVSQPRTGEKTWDVVHELVKTEPGGVLVLDSLAALVPTSVIDEPMEQQSMGKYAQMNNRGISETNTFNDHWVFLLINQLRESVGVSFGSPEVLPGGKAQLYFGWQRIRCWRAGKFITEKIDGVERRIGYNMRLVLEKNKQGVPWKETTIPFMFTGDFDELSGLVELAIELDVIEAQPPNYHFEGEKYWGRKRLLATFRDKSSGAIKIIVKP